jgi:hypothetical protein
MNVFEIIYLSRLRHAELIEEAARENRYFGYENFVPVANTNIFTRALLAVKGWFAPKPKPVAKAQQPAPRLTPNKV